MALSAMALLLGVSSCSINKMATHAAADAIANGPDVFSSDNDPQLVRDAIPFGLKTMESFLATLPKDPDLLLACARGFTQYAVGFIAMDASAYGPDQYDLAKAEQERALRLLVRGRDYGLRGLELHHKGIAQALQTHPDSAATSIGKSELPMLFWTAAAWGSAIGLGKDQPELLADIDGVRALIRRALALDDTYEHGSLHEAAIVLEALPREMGGSLDRAREHFDRAIALTHGGRASTYVTWAESVSIPRQNRAEFDMMLDKALEFDPDHDPAQRLLTLLSQRKARALKGRVDDLFIAPADSTQ